MPNDTTQPPGRFQVHQSGATYVPTAQPMDFQAPAALTIGGVALTATIAELNNLGTGVGTVAFDRLKKVAKVALGHADTGGGILSWVNPEATPILITDFKIYVTTVATGALSADFGTTPTTATTASDNLIDGVDLHTATGLFDLVNQVGANGLIKQLLAAGAWITGSKDSGAAAGLVGFAYIEYIVV